MLKGKVNGNEYRLDEGESEQGGNAMSISPYSIGKHTWLHNTYVFFKLFPLFCLLDSS